MTSTTLRQDPSWRRHLPKDYSDIVKHRDKIATQLRNLEAGSKDGWRPGKEEKAKRLLAGLDRANGDIEIAERHATDRFNQFRDISAGIENGTVTTSSGESNGSDRDTSHMRPRNPELAEAVRAVRSNLIVDEPLRSAAIERTEVLGRAQPGFARYARAVADEAYMTAFAKLAADPERGQLMWTTDEQRAFATAQAERAMIVGADAQGGYAVPLQLDPTIIGTSDGSLNPLRRLARVVNATSDVWQGVSSDGVTARWAPEATEANDDSPTLAGPTVPIHKADSFCPYSIELGQDWGQIATELGRMFQDAKDLLEGAAFINGTGVDQPTGLAADLDANGAAQAVAPDAAGVLSAVDIRNLWAALPSRYRVRASWLSDAPNLAAIQALGNGSDSDFTVDFTAEGVQRLIGREAIEDDAVTASPVDLIFGDFEHYVIADRAGMSVELIPHLLGANNRPTGQRGLYAYWRVGGAPVNRKAFRHLTL